MTMNEDITTIFVVGFPDDMREREFQNLFLFASDFEGAVLKVPSSFSINSIAGPASYAHHSAGLFAAGNMGASYLAAAAAVPTSSTSSSASSASTSTSTPVASHLTLVATGALSPHTASLPLSATHASKPAEMHDAELSAEDMSVGKENIHCGENHHSAHSALSSDTLTPLCALHSSASSHASSSTSLPIGLKRPSSNAAAAPPSLSYASPAQAGTPTLSQLASPTASIPAAPNSLAAAPYANLMCQSNLPRKQIIGFARFKTQTAALQAIDVISGKKIDPERCSLIMKAELAKKNLLPKRNSICVSDYMPAANCIYGSSPYGVSSYMGPDVSGNKYLYPTGPYAMHSLGSNGANGSSHSMGAMGLGSYPTAPFHHRQSAPFSPALESIMYSSSCHSTAAIAEDSFLSLPDTFDSASLLSSGKFDAEPDAKEAAAALAFGTSMPTFAPGAPFSSHLHSRSHSLVDFKLLVDPLLDYTDYYGVSGSASLAGRSAPNEASEENDVSTAHLFAFLDDEERAEASEEKGKHASPPTKTGAPDPPSRANELESILEVESDSLDDTAAAATHAPGLSQPPPLTNSSPPSAIKPPSRTDTGPIHSPPPNQPRNAAGSSLGTVATPSDFFLCDTPPPHVGNYMAPAAHRSSFSMQDSYGALMSQHAGQKPPAFDPSIFGDELEGLTTHSEPLDAMHLGALASALPQPGSLAAPGAQRAGVAFGASVSVSGDSSYHNSKPSSPLPLDYLNYHLHHPHPYHHPHPRDGASQGPYAGGFGRVSSGSLPHIMPNYGGLASSQYTISPSAGQLPAYPAAAKATLSASAATAAATSIASGLTPQAQAQAPAPLFRNGPNGTLYPIGENPPCNTLYVGNLPMSASEEELRNLFSNCPGYKRLSFKTKPNGPMCFVEFEDVNCATHAMNELYGSMLSSSTKGGIRLSYSKNPLGVRPPGTLPKSMASALMALHASSANSGPIDSSMMMMYHGAAHAHSYALSPPMGAVPHLASPAMAAAPPPASSHMMAMMMAQGAASDYAHAGPMYGSGLGMARNMSEPMIYAPMGGSGATRMHGLMAGGMAGSSNHSSTTLPFQYAASGSAAAQEEKRHSTASFLDMFLSSSTTAVSGGDAPVSGA